jgi:hypothetical protein
MTAAKTKELSKKDADIFFCDGALKRQMMVPIDPWGGTLVKTKGTS